MEEKSYLCIDLKSFYASVECVERGLDPFEVNLVVADPDRGQGAITLAATPAIKKKNVKSRGRIYEIPKGIEYIIAPPRMSLYMEYSAKIYSVLLRYIGQEDIHVYSIDESFLDVSSYLALYKMTSRELAKTLINAIYEETGICATAGIGTNLFLAKVALDIMAKHTKDGVAYLNVSLFRQKLWKHQPLTDFWMIGPGTLNHLKRLGIYDLWGITQFPENILYREFGVMAEILIDHAWGLETVQIEDIKKYQPKANSISNSQILFEDYTFEEAYIILKEMVDSNVLVLSKRHLVSDRIALFIGYSKNCCKPSRGQVKISNCTHSFKILMEEFTLLYQRIVKPEYPIRQIGISFGNIQNEMYAQYNLFIDFDEIEKEDILQKTIVKIQDRFGKNACLKGMNFLPKATARYRNTTIGGHKA